MRKDIYVISEKNVKLCVYTQKFTGLMRSTTNHPFEGSRLSGAVGDCNLISLTHKER